MFRNIIKSIQCRNISTSPILLAEPPKKKIRIDPAVLRTRVERKIKKFEREILKLEREPRQPIPILEYQLSGTELKNLKARPGRNMDDLGVSEPMYRAAKKLWGFYCQEQYNMAMKSIQRAERAQNHALKCLNELDKDLYNNTVSVDDLTLIPYSSSHICKETPANPDYSPPDGHIKNVTKEYVM